MRTHTLDLGHFEKLYESNQDPWRFASSPYERAKYDATLAMLPRERYGRGLDVGCSIGVLTEALARRCDDLLGLEPVESALEQARARNADQPWVRFAPLFVPAQWPDDRFDLVVVSEVIDYLGAADLTLLGARLRGSLQPGGDLVLVHWIGKKQPGPPRDEASDALIQATAEFFDVLRQERTTDYRIDLLRRR